MAKSHVVLMMENIIPLEKARTQSPSPPPKGLVPMGNTNQEVPKQSQFISNGATSNGKKKNDFQRPPGPFQYLGRAWGESKGPKGTFQDLHVAYI